MSQPAIAPSGVSNSEILPSCEAVEATLLVCRKCQRQRSVVRQWWVV